MQRHTLAANRIIGQLSRYQQDANQDPEAARTDPVPGMLQELVNENFFGFLDQLSRAPRVRNLLTNAAREELCVLIDYSRALLLAGESRLPDGLEQYCYADAVPPADIHLFPGQSLLERCLNRNRTQSERLSYALQRQKQQGLELRPNSRRPVGEHICHLCGLVLSDNSGLSLHWLNFHPGFEPHICPTCHQAFRSESKLRKHAASHVEYSCKHCPAVYRSAAGLASHELHHQENARGLQCPHCSFRAEGARALATHSYVHPETERRVRKVSARRAPALRNRPRAAEQPPGTEDLAVRIDMDPETYEQYKREEERRLRSSQLLYEQELTLSRLSLGMAKNILRQWDVDESELTNLHREEAVQMVRRMSQSRADANTDH